MPDMTMTQEEIHKQLAAIAALSRQDMAELWRYAPVGHPYFDKTLPFVEIFEKRFKELGGFSPEISKAIDR